jgi:hypothetical protein
VTRAASRPRAAVTVTMSGPRGVNGRPCRAEPVGQCGAA